MILANLEDGQPTLIEAGVERGTALERGKRIVFVLPGLCVAGGVRFIFKVSDRLVRRGYDVKIITPRQMAGRLASLLGPRMRAMVSRARGVRSIDSFWVPTEAEIIEIPELDERYLPDADYVFATAWQTAHFVNSLPMSKGERFYFIQHYETWWGDVDTVDETWRLPLRKVVTAPWLAEQARDRFGDPNARVINYALDPDEFWIDKKTPNDRPRVLMMYHHHEWKGCADGFKAIAMAREKVEFDLVLFGAHQPREDVPEGTEFHFDPPQEKLRELYRASDVFVSPSWLESGPMPPMEAMACECAVVATDSKGILEYAVHGENALLSPPKNPPALAESLVRVVSDRGLMQRLARNGRGTMERFTYERTTQQLLDILNNGQPRNEPG